MTDSPPGPRTAAALAARRKRVEAGLLTIEGTLDHMLRSRTPITFMAVARQAGVSRTFLYENTRARSLVEGAMSQAAGRRIEDRQNEDDALEAAWQERARNAEDALKAAHKEILAQRNQIGELLGQVRDLQTQWTEEDLLRVVNDNNSLNKQVRLLTNESTELQRKLTPARDNVRFADKRIAPLEAEYAAAVLT
jgi:chromosome segregation ATPase